MADERSAPRTFPGSAQPWIAQLRAITDEIARTAGVPDALAHPAAGRPGLPLPALPLPGALSAAQLSAITSAAAAQRASIAALQAQLKTFDEQLAVLEGIVAPLAEWSQKWAEFEGLLTAPRRDQGAGG
jgi:hypothetical protein